MCSASTTATLLPSPALSVIIPAFNERARLPTTLQNSLDFLRTEVGYEWELIIVDDGSTDDTAIWIADELADEPNMRMIRSTSNKNRGKGAALAAGCTYARGERLLFMDADGGTPLSALPQLEDVMSSTGCGIVIGSRSAAQSAVPRPWYRRLMGFVFSGLTATCVSGVDDTRSGRASNPERPTLLLPLCSTVASLCAQYRHELVCFSLRQSAASSCSRKKLPGRRCLTCMCGGGRTMSSWCECKNRSCSVS